MFVGDIARDVLEDLDEPGAPPKEAGLGRRLRDLRAVLVRNLRSLLYPERTCPHDALYSLYVEDDQGREKLVHCSEIMRHTFNPSFLPIEPRTLNQHVTWDCTCCAIRVWSLPGSEAELGESVVQTRVDVSQLVRVRSNQAGFTPNALVFEFADGLYAFPETIIYPGDGAETPRREHMAAAPASEVSMTCGAAFSFMESALEWRAKMELEEQEMRELKEALAARLLGLNKATQQAQLRRRQHRRLVELQQRVAEQQAVVDEQRDALGALRAALPPHAAAVQEAPLVLQAKVSALSAQRDGLQNYQAVLNQVSSSHSERCWALVAALFAVFPIRATKDAGILQIHGLPLRITKDFAGCDEASVCTAIGYATHLLFHLSKLLGICLKHPLIPGVSNSRVAVDSSSQTRAHPLFYKGSEKRLAFDYGLYLMNKDIAQVLRAVGIKAGHPSETLPNLHAIYRIRCCPTIQPTGQSDHTRVSGAGGEQ